MAKSLYTLYQLLGLLTHNQINKQQSCLPDNYSEVLQ